MASASARADLHDLITHFVAWHESFSSDPTEQTPGLAATEREALLAELRSFSESAHKIATPQDGAWVRLRAWFGASRPDVSTRERALLTMYEQTCEVAPPTRVLNALLRQYQAIKQASLREQPSRVQVAENTAPIEATVGASAMGR